STESRGERHLEPVRQEMSLARLRNDPRVWLERDALMAMVQQGNAIGVELMSQAVTAHMNEPNLRVVRDAIGAALPSLGSGNWVETILELTPQSHRGLVRELAVASMPQRNPAGLTEYAREIVISLLDRDLVSLKQ